MKTVQMLTAALAAALFLSGQAAGSIDSDLQIIRRQAAIASSYNF